MRIPKPSVAAEDEEAVEATSKSDNGVLLPQTLVRIPATEGPQQVEVQLASEKEG